jgi:hypothetical protein
VRGKGTAGLGILLAAGLIIWAVARPAPDTEEAGPSNDTTMGTTARRAAGGAVVGVGTTVAPPPPAPGAVPELDPEVLRELFAQALREAGLDIEPGQIQGLVAQYQAIAARANALLSSAAANPGLLSAGAPPSLDPNQILNFLASQLGAAFIPRGVVPVAPVAKKPAHAPQPAAPRPASAPDSGAAVEGGKGDMMQMEPDLEMDMDMNMDMRMNMDMD